MGERARCRACNAPIEFVRTTTGRRMPLDLTSHPDANIIVNDDGTATVVPKGEGVRISHFATCADAARFRRNRGRK